MPRPATTETPDAFNAGAGETAGITRAVYRHARRRVCCEPPATRRSLRHLGGGWRVRSRTSTVASMDARPSLAGLLAAAHRTSGCRSEAHRVLPLDIHGPESEARRRRAT